jgi:hypothetical protein
MRIIALKFKTCRLICRETEVVILICSKENLTVIFPNYNKNSRKIHKIRAFHQGNIGHK